MDFAESSRLLTADVSAEYPPYSAKDHPRDGCESLTSNARRARDTHNRFTKRSKEKPSSVGMASSPSRTKRSGLRARKAATISGKAPVRLLLALIARSVLLVAENDITKSVPLRLVHPVLANWKGVYRSGLRWR